MPTATLANPNAVCSAAMLGAIIGKSDRRIRQLTSEGILKPARSRNGAGRYRYRLGENVQRFVRYECDLVREQFSMKNGELEAAKTRKAIVDAESAEIDLKIKKGTLLVASDLDFELGLMLVNFRDRMRSIAPRVMNQVSHETDALKCNQIVASEVNSALTEVSDSKYHQVRNCAKRRAYLKSKGLSEDVIEEIVNSSSAEQTPAD
jgi:hypothetical protein